MLRGRARRYARRQRELVSDPSHELRSPIAATRAQFEVALAHADRAGAGSVLRGVLAETARLEGLVADLLALARLDERLAPLHEELDLDDLAFNPTDHRYTYEVVGDDNALQVRVIDKPYADNSGRVRISLLPGV